MRSKKLCFYFKDAAVSVQAGHQTLKCNATERASSWAVGCSATEHGAEQKNYAFICLSTRIIIIIIIIIIIMIIII